MIWDTHCFSHDNSHYANGPECYVTHTSWNSLVDFRGVLGCHGFAHYEFIPEGRTLIKEIYSDILRRLRDAVRRKLH